LSLINRSMSHPYSTFLTLLSESATLAMSRKSRELRKKGVDVINLSLGEPDFDTPDFIKEAAAIAMDENYTHYMAVNGYEDFRDSISNKFKRDNNLNYTSDQIVVSTGAKQSLANIIFALIDEGDEVILPAPYWVTYLEQIKMVKGIPVPILTSIENEYKISPGQLEKAINEKSKLFIFNSPSNPSGAIYSKEEIIALGNVLTKYPHVFILSDEIYEHITYEEKHYSIGQIPELFDRVITVNGVSKAFAMTGWRIGYMGAPEWIAKACTKVQGQITSGANGIGQRAAKAAVEADPKTVKDMVLTFQHRRDLILSEMRKINGLITNLPGGAFYIYPNVSYFFGKKYNNLTINNSTDLCEYLLEKANVATVPGEAFGTSKHIRISYAASDELLIEAASRMKKALSNLK
jgi:aspartate aminotransferase